MVDAGGALALPVQPVARGAPPHVGVVWLAVYARGRGRARALARRPVEGLLRPLAPAGVHRVRLDLRAWPHADECSPPSYMTLLVSLAYAEVITRVIEVNSHEESRKTKASAGGPQRLFPGVGSTSGCALSARLQPDIMVRSGPTECIIYCFVKPN